jgi:hypothetical protein
MRPNKVERKRQKKYADEGSRERKGNTYKQFTMVSKWKVYPRSQCVRA